MDRERYQPESYARNQKTRQRAHIYDFRIDGLHETEDDLRKLEHFEFQNWIIDVLHGKHSARKTHDMGIDGYYSLTSLRYRSSRSTASVGRR